MAAAVSAFFVWLQVREMQRQTALQRSVAEAAVQPYVWADVRVQSGNGWFLEFIVGNSGATTATDVRVRVEPRFPEAKRANPNVMHDRLEAGIASLTPGHSFAWTLGEGHELVNRDGPMAHAVTIDGMGPNGPLPTSSYVIDMANFREAVAHKEGNLAHVERAIKDLAGKTNDGVRVMRAALERWEEIDSSDPASGLAE